MTLTLLNEHHFEFLSLKGGCTGLSESTRVKMPHCWKSHITAHLHVLFYFQSYAGKYVPAIGYKIHIENKSPFSLLQNFAGIAIGDGLCDPETVS